MRRSIGAAIVLTALLFSSMSAALAAGTNGVVIWSDDTAGTTTRTGSVFGTRCGSGSPNAIEEAATLSQLDGWATSAVAANFTLLSPAITPANNVSGDNAVLSFPGTNGVTMTVSRRQVLAAEAADLTNNSVGAFSPNALFKTSTRMQDCAPRPSDLTVPPAGMSLTRTAEYSGLDPIRESFWNATSFPAGNQLDATLFEFSEPIGAFGLWFGDLETRPPIAAAPGGGVLAVVKLFDSAGNLVNASTITPDEVAPDDTVCGGTPASADGLGCGNQSTRFVGFVEPSMTVTSMLVIVGDDDSCTQTRACNGISEYLSWVGPMVGLTQPDLEVTKTIVAPFPTTPGDPVTWTIEVANVGNAPASPGWVVSDAVGPGATGLALSGAAAEVDCSSVTSCTGLVPIAAGASVSVTATATHTAGVGVSVDNVAYVIPLASDIAEIVPAGTAPAPGDDTDATATNNDASAVHLIAEDAQLSLRKLANGLDADVVPGAEAEPGTTITYTFEVTAAGNVGITGLAITDDNATPGDPGDDWSPTYVSGDSNSNGVVDPGETWLYTGDSIAGTEEATNTATANGASLKGTLVEATDIAISSPPPPPASTTTTTSPTTTSSTTDTTLAPSTTIEVTTTEVAKPPGLAVTGSESKDLAMTAIVLLMIGILMIGAGHIARTEWD